MGLPQGKAGLQVAGLEAKGFSQGPDGVLVPALPVKGDGVVVMEDGFGPVQPDGLQEVALRLPEVFGREVRLGESHMSLREPG